MTRPVITRQIALGQNPDQKFDGDYLEFVAFRSMFRNTYELAIKSDGVTAFAIFCRHLTGDAANVIKACNFISDDNRYVEALAQLQQRFGQKVSVIKAHKKHIISG